MKQPNTSCNEIEIHYKRPLFETMPVLRNNLETMAFIKSHIDINRIDFKEFFWVVLLTHNNSVLGFSNISSGSTTATLINIREIVQLALMANATGVILVHNHPSGKLKPSSVDTTITKKCKAALDLIEVSLLDHLIISSEHYYSFMEENMI